MGLYYIANIEDKSRLDIYRHKIPIEQNEAELLVKPDEGILSIQATSDDGKYALIQQMKGNAKQNLRLLDLQELKETEVTEQINERDTRWQPVKFLDNSTFLVNTDHHSNFRRLAVISSEGEFHTYEVIESQFMAMCETTAYSRAAGASFAEYVTVKLCSSSSGCVTHT